MEGVGSGCDQALNLESARAADGGEAEQVQDELVQDSEGVSGMIGADLHLVVAKSPIHAPVQTVFDTPLQANALLHALGVRGQAADIGAPLA